MTTSISNSDDVIDSRDVIARIEELKAQVDGTAGLDEEERAELEALEALASAAEGYAPDWEHGAVLIRDSYFTDYCEELVKDIGALPRDLPGYLEIDWEMTANNLQIDYTSVEFDGVTYWVR